MDVTTPQPDPANPAVPPGEPSLYERLQVSSTASPAVIEAAYHALCQATPAATAALTAAYQVLRDPRRRVGYDLALRQDRPASADEPPTRVRSCWRCAEPLGAAETYCSTCHWTICVRC